MKEFAKIIIALLLFCTEIAFATTLAVTYPANLKKNELLKLETVACLSPYGLKIENVTAYTYEENSKEIQTNVICESNATFEGNPLKNTAYCDNQSGNWQCKERFIKVIALIKNKDVDLYLAGVSPKIAYESLQKLSNFSFQSKSIEKVIGSSCTVYNGGSNEEYEFNCSEGSMLVSYFCPTNSCPRIVWLR